ncbi:MAG: aconitase X catalytic domain-containing protein [Thermoplasmata archaeon]
MYLSNEEERILQGEKGTALQKAMELLNSLGTIFGAEKLIEIKSAQISGVSYKNMGDGGIDFLQHFKGEKVKVKTTLNPIGFDIEYPHYLNLSSDFIAKQIKILNLYKSMGVLATYTCTPYYFENIPSFGDDIAWAESSAVIYANSILGARTNRESGVSAMAAALLGKTPFYGLHIPENRKATLKIVLKFTPSMPDFAVIGLLVGEKVKSGIPYITGIRDYTETALKSLGAAMNATGAIPMFHAEMITPEWKISEQGLEKITIEEKDIKEYREKFNSHKDPELVALGCPHLSYSELKEIALYLKNKKKKENVELWLFTSRSTKQKAYNYVAQIEDFGGKVYADTCMVVAPINLRFKVTATNSGKAVYYLRLPNYSGQDTIFYDIYTLLEMVCK